MEVRLRLLQLAVFIQSILAGAMISGVLEARTLHRTNAMVIILLLVIVSFAVQKSGNRYLLGPVVILWLTILSTATAGVLSAQGHRLHWLHIPLAVGTLGIIDFMISLGRASERLPFAGQIPIEDPVQTGD